MHEETTAEGKKVKFGYRCGIFFPMSAKSTQQLANPLLTTWSSVTTVLAGARQKDAKSRSQGLWKATCPEKSEGDAGDLGVQQGTRSWALCCISSGFVEHPSLGGIMAAG